MSDLESQLFDYLLTADDDSLNTEIKLADDYRARYHNIKLIPIQT